jgi:nitrous oxide reductase accessory protein NosL
MGKLRRIALAAAVAFIFTDYRSSICMAAEAQIGKAENSICNVCGMYLERFKKTNATVDYKNGKSEIYCGVACAIRAINEHGGMDEVSSAQVTGWMSQNKVGIERATYVIGSRLIPDMVPNIIAFDNGEEAAEFISKNGGKIESLEALLAGTSYRGLTAPFRIPAAAVPSQGVLMIGVGASFKEMDGLMNGDSSISDAEAFKTRTMIMDKMSMSMYMANAGYGVTDDLFCSVSIPSANKESISIMKSNGAKTTTSTSGLGDISLMGRWRFWHDTDFDKHLGLLGSITFPTGKYDTALRSNPNLQLGNGAYGFTFGPLYSQHVGKFWFHAAATYKWNLKNSDDFQYGDCANYGVAAHFLPNTSDLIGFEFDGETVLRNRYLDAELLNSGKTAWYYNLVYQRKILLLLGGNVNISALFGLPAYQKVNEIQLGEQYHASAMAQWQTKF